MTYPKTTEFFNECLAVLSFDEETGKFMEHRTKDGHSWLEPAGRLTAYGVRLTVNLHQLPAHHLTWRMFHGEWPTYHVKHLNGDVTDNRPLNLHAPGKAKQDKKHKGGMVPFLKSLGVSDRQIARMSVDNVRKTSGELVALDLEKRLGLITAREYTERIEELGINPNGSK